MSFVHAELFWILILPIVLFSFFILRHKDNLLHIFDELTLKRLSIGDNSISMMARNTLMLLALFFMLIALSRPVINRGEYKIESRGISAVVAVDVSASMRAKDIYPNRLEFAKKNINYLLSQMPNDEISLVSFSDLPFMLAPFSSDKVILNSMVNGIDINSITMNSTNLTALVDFTDKLLSKKEPKILIIFSDGGDREDVENLSKIVLEKDITLYVVLIGTETGSPIIDSRGKVITQNGKIVISKRDDILGEIAIKSGGDYIIANRGKYGIEKLVKSIQKSYKSEIKKEITIYDREELFYYPLGIGLFLLLISLISLPRRY